MKRIADYKDDAAFDLLADLLEPVSKILADSKMREMWSKPKIMLAEYILRTHKAEAMEILKAIDKDVEITAVSVLKGIIDIITDIQSDPAIKDFFKFAEQGNEESDTSGSATANTEEHEK